MGSEIVAEHHYPEYRGDHAIDAVTLHKVRDGETVAELVKRLTVGQMQYGQAWIVLRRLHPEQPDE